MSWKSVRAWLGVDRPQDAEFAPLRDTLDALDNLEPDRARFLAAFAYLLGRVASADQHVSAHQGHGQEGPISAVTLSLLPGVFGIREHVGHVNGAALRHRPRGQRAATGDRQRVAREPF